MVCKWYVYKYVCVWTSESECPLKSLPVDKGDQQLTDPSLVVDQAPFQNSSKFEKENMGMGLSGNINQELLYWREAAAI
jgi:hypothetical protein